MSDKYSKLSDLELVAEGIRCCVRSDKGRDAIINELNSRAKKKPTEKKASQKKVSGK